MRALLTSYHFYESTLERQELIKQMISKSPREFVLSVALEVTQNSKQVWIKRDSHGKKYCLIVESQTGSTFSQKHLLNGINIHS